jgi:hypothetical protein
MDRFAHGDQTTPILKFITWVACGTNQKKKKTEAGMKFLLKRAQVQHIGIIA